jgi:hypothetical protein
VWRRDGGRCRIDGCRSARRIEIHHSSRWRNGTLRWALGRWWFGASAAISGGGAERPRGRQHATYGYRSHASQRSARWSWLEACDRGAGGRGRSSRAAGRGHTRTIDLRIAATMPNAEGIDDAVAPFRIGVGAQLSSASSRAGMPRAVDMGRRRRLAAGGWRLADADGNDDGGWRIRTAQRELGDPPLLIQS